MSTNKKFRIQNGVDITGEVVVGNQLVITAEGKLVLPAIEGAISDAVSADIAALQAQVDAILGTSPEHLDTLQEIVALFQSEDGDISTLITNNSTAITQIQQTLASGVATAAQGALADTAAQQSDLDAVIAQITDGVATAAQGALADTAVQPEDFGAGLESVTSSSLDLTSVLGDVTTTYIPSDIEYNGEGLPLYTGRFWGAWSGWKNNHGGAYDLALVTHDQLGYANNLNGAALPTVLVMGNFEGGGDPAFVGTQLSGPAGSQFGSSLTFNDNYIVVGAKNQSSNEGAIHVYTTDANSFIRKTDTITGSDISGNTNGEFGSYAVMVPGADEVIVSEPKSQDLVGQNHWGGRVYHINLADGSLIKEFTVPNPRYNMQLGDGYYGGMVIKGDNLFVCESGVPGGNSKVHQFSISTGTHIRELVAPDGPNMERFGSALAIVGDYLVVGERVEGEDIFVFDMDGNLTSSIIVDSPSHDGWCLARALDDNTVVMKSGTDVLNPSSFHVFNVDSSGVISLSFIHSEDVTDINTFNDTIVTVNAGDYNTTTPDQTIKLLTPSSITTTSFEVDTSTIATKAYVDSGVAGVDLSDYSTTTQMDSAIAVETAAAIAAIPATDLTTYSTTVEMDSAIATAKSEAQTYADQVVADTVDAAPAALDTLNELAAALGDDANFASTVTASLADKVSTYTFDNKVSELQQDINLKADKTVNFNITGAASSGSPVIINEDGTISAIGTSVPVSELSELVTSDSMEITNQAENWATVYNMTGDYPLNDNYARQRQMLVAEPIQISNDANGNERFLHAFAQGEDTHLAVYAVIDGVLTYVSRSVDEKSPGWIQDMAYNSTSNTVLLVGRNHYSSKIFYSGVTVSESGVIQFGNSMYSTQNRTQFWRTGNSVIVEPIADRFLCVSVDFGDWYTIVEQVNVTLGAETYVSLEKSQQVYNTGWNRPPRTSGGKLFSGPSTIGGGTSVYVAGNDTFPMTQDYNNNGDPAWKQRYIYQGARATVISWNSSTQEFNDFNGAWTYIDNGVGIDHVAGMTVGSDGSIHMIGFKGNPDISLDTMVIVKGLYNLNYSHTLTLGTNTPSSSELMFVDEGGKSPRWFASEFHGSTFARLSDGSFLLSFAYHNENVSIATISAEGVVTGVVDTGYAVGSGYDNKQWYPSDIQSKSFVSSSDEMYHIITRANYDSSTSDGQADSGWATHKLGSFIPDPATYLGIAQGDNGDVVISGGVVSGFTGLIPSTIYYVQSDGALSTTETNIKAGIAISENDILVSDNLDDAKQDLSPYATKEYVDSGVAGVDLSAYSTTTEMDSAIAVETDARTAAIAAIPATDLTPYSTTVEMGSAIATAKSEAQSYADQVVASTIDAAPASLDTLNELAAALGDDANFASTVTASIATKADDAATTAALASKVGLAEVDVRMEPIKQLAESAIQPSDLGDGISLSSQTLVDWSSDSVLQTPATIAAPSSATSDAWAYGTIIANNSTKWATNDWIHDGDKGRVYVFNQSDNSLAFTLDGTSSGERMGAIGLIMNDQYIVAGSYNYNGQQGRVHVFSAVDGSPLHIFEPDNVPNPWNTFTGRFGGRGLALEGSNLYVGTTEHILIGDGNVDGQNEAGAVYHFDLSTGNKVSRIENPIAEGYVSNKWFGREISVHGNNVYVSYGDTHGGLHHYTLSDSTLTLQNSFAFSGISGIGSGANSQFGQQTDTNGTYFIAYAPMNQTSSGTFGVIVYKNEDLHNGVFEPVYNIDTTHKDGGLLFIDGNTIAASVGSDNSIQIYTLGDTLSEVVTGQTLSAGNIFSREGTSGGAKPFAYLSDSSKFLYTTEQTTTDIGVYDVVSSSTSSYVVDDSLFATKDYVDSGVAGVDLSAYSTTTQMDSAIAAIPSTDLTPYSTTAQMDSAIAVETGARETAVTSAISTASDDATAKANAAQAAAEATASADATAKADAAQAAAIAAAGTAATQAIAATVDAAPASLDTLNELAAALGDDANFASTVTASIATKADDAATTAALASKVGLAEVDVRMEPIKQTAESAIQPSDLGTGIAETSSSVVDWSSLTSEDFAAISDTDLLYTKYDQVIAVDATDTHFVTLMMSNIPGDTSDTYRELTVNVHLLDGTLVKSFQATEDYPELNYSHLSYLSVNGNYISLSRNSAVYDDTGTGSYSKIYDIRNIDQADHGLVKTINEDNLRRLFTIDDTRAIAVYGATYNVIDTVKVHNISDWAELYSFDPMGGYGTPDEADFGGGYFVTGGVSGAATQGITILSTSGSYGLAGIAYNSYWHGPSNNHLLFANGITVSDKYVVFRTQDTDGTNRAHVHSPVDGSHIRSFVEESSTPWQVLNNTKGLGKAALALSGDVLFIPLVDYNSSTYQLKKGVAVYNILTGELLNELTVFDGARYTGAGSSAENLYNVYTVSGSTIIDINEEMFDAGSISPRIATAPTTSVLSYGVDTSVFATKDYVDSGVDGNEGRLTTAENNLTALEADLSSEENARGAGDTALGLRLDSDKSELDTAIGSLSARLDSDKSELGAAIDAAIEQEVQTPLDLEIGRGSKSLRVGRNTVANTDGGIAIGDAANAAGAKSIALGTSATPTGDNGIEIKTSEDGTLSYSSDSDWSFGAPVTAPSFIGDGSGLTGISSDVTGAIAAEETRATTAEAGLQSQISNVLSNTDATALNSLAEIVTEFQNADSTLSGVIGGHGTRLTDLEGRTTDNIPEGITNKYYSDELVKTALSGGLCINDTKLQSTGEIAIDEVEAEQTLRVAEAVVSDDTSKLEGQDGSHYRIDIYDVNGVIIND